MNVNWYNPDNQNDNLRARAEVSVKKPPIKAVSFYMFKYLSQPLVIFDNSCKSISKDKYIFWVIMFSSAMFLIRCFTTSVIIRSFISVGGLSVLFCKAAVMVSSNINRHRFSIRRCMPKWSRLGSLFPSR